MIKEEPKKSLAELANEPVLERLALLYAAGSDHDYSKILRAQKEARYQCP